ncbi:MAG TPA: helix-turn-helix transcriptional regulator, partial [Alphaproteobacteria bacterium]|nr:helix-turn-helix transcriptional regulator [Alphaproteobacteria bacterium]
MKNNIRALREEQGWSQEKLAKAAGTSAPQINRLEKSQRRLTQEWMMKIAGALGCHPSDLLPAHPANDKTGEAPRRFLREEERGLAATVPVLGKPGAGRDSIIIDADEEAGRALQHPSQAGARHAFAIYAR